MFMQTGEETGAQQIFAQEMAPAMEETFKGFEKLRMIAGQAEDLYLKMENQAMVRAREKELRSIRAWVTSSK
jgi:3-methyladenine DNA glycosylase Tag